MTAVAQSVLTRLAADPRGCVTVAEMLFDGYADHDKQLHNALDVLERRGFAERAARGCYTVTAGGAAWLIAGQDIQPGQGPHHAMRARGLPAAAWAWLRIHRKGSIHDMLATLATADQPSAETNLHRYLRALEGAGYVRRLKRGSQAARWLLVRDTGRQAPVYRRKSATLADPNTGEVWALTREAP